MMPRTTTQELTAQIRSTLPGGFVELSPGVTHYDLQGLQDAPTVVLVHGNAAPYITWDRTVGPLCDAGFRVLRYDLFGHGFSDRPRLPKYDRSWYVAQLAELLRRLGIEDPARLVGTSQGGSIAACFAATHPGVVARLALLAPLVDELPGAASLTYRLVRAPKIGELLLRSMSDSKLADISDAVVSGDTGAELQPRITEQFRYRGKREAILANLRGDSFTDATDCYRSVREQGIPVFLTWGSLDQKIPRESMNRLRELIPDIESHEIEGVGHLAHYEFPDLVNPLLIRFLTG
jgi:pimeloyl-ACP methyl ester carboxylesterase